MKNQPIFSPLLVIATLLLSACGGGESDTGGGGSDIKSFSVTGTDGRNSRVATLDPALNEGLFEVNWNVDDFGFYWVRMAVSSDRKYGAGDRLFFDEACGGSGNVCPDGRASVSCGFGNNNVIACDSELIGNAWMGPDLTTFLDVLPKRAFIVVEVCTATKYFDCYWTSSPIEFR